MAQAPLLPVAAEDVDSEIDSQSDQDGGEHHGQNVEMSDRQGGVAHRPGDRHHQGEHRQQRLGDAPVKQNEQQGHAGQGIAGSSFDVGMGGVHLIRGKDLAAGHPDFDVRETGNQIADDGPDAFDGIPGPGEVAFGFLRIEQDEQQAFVVGDQVPGFLQGMVLLCQKGSPRRTVPSIAFDVASHLREQGDQQTQIGGIVRRLFFPGAEEIGEQGLDHARTDFAVEAGEQGVESG